MFDSLVGYNIHTHGDGVEEVHRNVREAVDCYFDETMARPSMIRCAKALDDDVPDALSAATVSSGRLAAIAQNTGVEAVNPGTAWAR